MTLILAKITFAVGYRSEVGIIIGLWLFFSAFNLLESLLPSLISRLAPVDAKGATIGVYSTAQFLGAFAGGAACGEALGLFGAEGVFLLALVVLAGWLLLIIVLPEPKLLVTHVLELNTRAKAVNELARKLTALPGVAEAVVLPDQGVAYLKVDPEIFSEQAVTRLGLEV